MLPDLFLQRFEQLCPAELLPEALGSFEQATQPAFRVNRLLDHPDKVCESLRVHNIDYQSVPWAHQAGIAAFTCPTEQRSLLTHHPAAESGAIYIQSLSSMLAPLYLAPQKHEWILDLAAAPGGKTLLLAELMDNQGKISAVEPVKDRFFRLKANLERSGVTNTQVYMKDGRAVGRLKPNTFDRVLLDAPCSSESRFKTYLPSSMTHWSLRKIRECASKQKRLLLSAFTALKPGGQLLYCTCSFAPEENEQVVDHLLRRQPNAHLLTLEHEGSNHTKGLSEWQGRKLHSDCANSLRIWPTMSMPGFFLASIYKAP